MVLNEEMGWSSLESGTACYPACSQEWSWIHDGVGSTTLFCCQEWAVQVCKWCTGARGELIMLKIYILYAMLHCLKRAPIMLKNVPIYA